MGDGGTKVVAIPSHRHSGGIVVTIKPGLFWALERSFHPTSNPPSNSNQSHQRKNHLHPDHTPKMQVSLAYLITILSVLVAVSNAEEVTGGKKTDDVESKWWAGYNTATPCLLPTTTRTWVGR
jgi:hypothetical protein